MLASIRSKVGLAQANYERDYLPALHKYAEFVQLFPASESHHHAQPGGLLIHALEAVDIALTLRRGVVLPIGAHPEELMHLEHRWTYGVFIAALLHDIGRPVADLNITSYGKDSPHGRVWTPLAGTLREIGSTHYSVGFTEPGKRNYQAHTRLGVAMLNRIVPQSTMAWMTQDATLMEELTAYLYGDSKGGALRDLASKADGESVRRNLLMGPRTRFAASRAVPLIERMMEALRRMLAEGGVLPLNRSGGAGWVYEGDVWFVSKRLADEVRKYLQANESGAGIPGEDKNDRLFDVWQEYGALVGNPDTGGAIWHVRVEGDGYVHNFTMLRFPLHVLFPSNDRYPAAMSGRVVVLEKRAQRDNSASPAQPAAQPTPAVGKVSEPGDAAEPPAQDKSEPLHPTPIAEVETAQPSSGATPTSASTTGDADIFSRLAALGGGGTNGGVDRATDKVDDGYLGDEKLIDDNPIATPFLAEKAGAPPPQSARSAPARQANRIPAPRILAPVSPHTPPPPKLPTVDSVTHGQEPPENARRLMAWIQEGIANGNLVYNVTGALVHFVEEDGSNMMLLVSPRIFRHYLESIGQATGEAEDKLGSTLQKEFFKAGWHRAGPKKTNILRYLVKRRGSSEGSLLSVVAIPHPERFVNPIPPPNPHITRYFNEFAETGSRPLPGLAARKTASPTSGK